MKSSFSKILIGMLFIGLFSPLYGQVGRIWGKVTDDTGEPIGEAEIEIQAMNIKRNYKLKTRKDGSFLHAGIHYQGSYRVIVRKEGFQGAYAEGVRPSLGESDRGQIDLVMRAGEARKLAFELTDEEKATMIRDQREAEKERAAFAAIQGQFNAGVEAYNAGSYEAAIDSFVAVAEKDSSQPTVWAHLANSYENLKKYDEAQDAYEKAIELRPEEAAFHQNLGNILAAKGDSEAANKSYEKAAQLATELDPGAAAATYYNMGVTHINAGDNDAAAAALNKAIETDPNHAEAYYQLGIVMLGLGKMDEAVSHLQKYVEITPDGPNAETAKALVDQLKG